MLLLIWQEKEIEAKILVDTILSDINISSMSLEKQEEKLVFNRVYLIFQDLK